MTDVVFLNPPYIPGFSRYSRSPCVTRGGTIYFPLDMASGSAYARGRGFNSKVCDAVMHGWDINDAWMRLRSMDPKLVVIATSTPSIENDFNIASKIFERTGINVVLTGRHVSRGTHENLSLMKKHDNITGILRKDFHKSVVQLLEGKDIQDVPGAWWLEDGEFKNNPDPPQINPNEIPYISEEYKLNDIDPRKYFYASCQYPYILISNTNGCPFDCTFCSECYKHSRITRSPDNLMGEIEYMKKEMPWLKEVLFDDPTFVIDEKETLDLCSRFNDIGMPFRWSMTTRANISRDTLFEMRKAGARLMHVGIESQNPDILKSINKNADIEKETQFLYDARDAGMFVHSCMIFGLPGDTPETLQANIDYIKKHPMDSCQIFPLIPTPEDENVPVSTWKWATENNFLINEVKNVDGSYNFSKYLKPDGSYNSVITQPQLSNTEVEQWIEKAYHEFYMRKGYFWYKFKQVLKDPSEFGRNWKGFKALMAKSNRGE